MKTKLESMAVDRMAELAEEAQQIVLDNHGNMGHPFHTDSGFGKLNERLRKIKSWADALHQAP